MADDLAVETETWLGIQAEYREVMAGWRVHVLEMVRSWRDTPDPEVHQWAVDAVEATLTEALALVRGELDP